jgi:2-dehydropantoate 2-reductase
LSSVHELQVAIIGAGAMGTLFAGLLGDRSAQAHCAVTVISRREEVVRAIGRSGIRIVDEPRQKEIVAKADAVRACLPSSLALPQAQFDFVLILTKTFDSEYAVACAKQLVAPDGVVACLQNGLSGHQKVSESFPASQVALGVTYEASSYKEPGYVHWTQHGHTVLGCCDANRTRLQELQSVLNASDLECDVSANIQVSVWRKLCLTMVNAVCGALARPLYQLLQSAEAVEVMRETLLETYAVARAAGVQLSRDEVLSDFDRLIVESHNMTGSVYQSFASGRPTEMNDLCDGIIEVAERVGYPATLARMLQRLTRIQFELGVSGASSEKV